MISSCISLDFNLKYLKGKGYYIRELDLKASCVLSGSLALLICSCLPLKLNCSWVVDDQEHRGTGAASLGFEGYPVKLTLSLPVSVALATLIFLCPHGELHLRSHVTDETMQGLRLCLGSTVTTIHRGEAWDICMPLLLSLLLLVRKSYSVNSCPVLCLHSFFLHPQQTAEFESTIFYFLLCGYSAVFT